MILSGTTSPWLRCQPARSKITTAWASLASWLLISRRWWFIARVLQIGMIRAAALPSEGQTAPNTSDAIVEARTVDVHVQRLRESITGEGEPDVIRTVRTAGYGFNME